MQKSVKLRGSELNGDNSRAYSSPFEGFLYNKFSGLEIEDEYLENNDNEQDSELQGSIKRDRKRKRQKIRNNILDDFIEQYISDPIVDENNNEEHNEIAIGGTNDVVDDQHNHPSGDLSNV